MNSIPGLDSAILDTMDTGQTIAKQYLLETRWDIPRQRVEQEKS